MSIVSEPVFNKPPNAKGLNMKEHPTLAVSMITTLEQLKKILAAAMAEIPAQLPPAVVELEVLARKKTLTTSEVAKLYGLNANTLRKRRVNGEGPAYSKDGSNVIYTHDAIRQYLVSCRQKTYDQP